MRPRLTTIPISHYGERARWALDFAGIDYDERHHLQMFSWVASYAIGGGKMLPVLETGDAVLTDSHDIVHFASNRADKSLYPANPGDRREVDQLELHFAAELGVESRRIAYEWFFRSFDRCEPYNAGRAPAFETEPLRRGWRGAVFVGSRYLQVSPAQVTQGIAAVAKIFDDTAARLRDGRRYLVGDTFTAADLTFATMAAPCLLPARYGVTLPPVDLLPEDAADRVRAWRNHEAGRFALRLYEERPIPTGRYERRLRKAPRDSTFPL